MRRITLICSVLLLFCSPARLLAACLSPNVTASNITINSFVGSWTGVPAVSYEYTFDQNPATPVIPGTPTTNVGQAFTGLLPNTAYYLHVRAYCGAANGFSAWITIQVHTLPLQLCMPPSGLIGYGLTNFSADITWAPVPGAISYQFLLNQSPTTPFVQGVPTALTFYNATNLQPGTTYYFHLRTDCSAYVTDTSAWEVISFTTPPLPPCQAPTGMAAANVTNTSADLSWNSQSGILGWEFVFDQSPANPVIGALTAGTSLSVTGLNSLTTYYLHLRTDCTTYPSDSSHWVTYAFVTKTDSCIEPSGLQLSYVYPSTAFASWNAAPGAYAYEYLVDKNPDAPTEGGTPTFSTFEEISGLASNTTYYLHVRSVCDTSLYPNNFTNWVTEPFYTAPGLNVKNAAGNGNFSISAAPNPVRDRLDIVISGSLNGSARIEICDITGRSLNSVVADKAGQLSLDMHSYAGGMYLLRYADDVQTYTLRIIKQ